MVFGMLVKLKDKAEAPASRLSDQNHWADEMK